MVGDVGKIHAIYIECDVASVYDGRGRQLRQVQWIPGIDLETKSGQTKAIDQTRVLQQAELAFLVLSYVRVLVIKHLSLGWAIPIRACAYCWAAAEGRAQGIVVGLNPDDSACPVTSASCDLCIPPRCLASSCRDGRGQVAVPRS